MPGPLMEGELIARFRDGERMALNHIYGLYYRRLCYFATNLVIDRQLAEDIVTESFVTLYKLRANFDSITNVRAFLFRAVRNACLNSIRQSKRQISAQQEIVYLRQNEADDMMFLEIETVLLESIYREVEALPKQCRQVFKLFYLERMNTLDIAAHMGLSRNTVQNHKIRAMKLLKTALLKKNLFTLLLLYAHLPGIQPFYEAFFSDLH